MALFQKLAEIFVSNSVSVTKS